VSILQRFQTRAPDQTNAPRKGHRSIGVAVGIHGQLGSLEPLVAHHAFDGGTGLGSLSTIGLRIGDSEAIACMRVDPDRGV